MSFELLSRRYQIQESIFKHDPKFIILNENGNCEYTVTSAIFNLGDHLSLFDGRGKELYKIRQELVLLYLNFNIFTADDTEVASVQCRGMPWNYKLEVTTQTLGKYQIDWQSGMLNQEFVLKKYDIVIARINRKWVSLTNNYSVEISDDVTDEDVPFVLCLVIVLWCAHRFRGQLPFPNS